MSNEGQPSYQGQHEVVAAATPDQTEETVSPGASSSGRIVEFRSFLKRLPGLLFSRRWWWSTLLVIAGMLLLTRLGFWQLSRLEWRRNLNTQLQQQLEAPPLDLMADALPTEIEDLKDRLASAEGQFDYKSQVLLTQQSWQGRPGVHLITPLYIDELGKAVLVDRGWIPAADAGQGDLSIFDDRANERIVGVIRLSERLPGAGPAPVEPKEEWYRVDIEAIEAQLPFALMPFYLQWLPEKNVTELPYRSEREVDLSEGSHLSYAIQWFSFAAILCIGYVALIYQQEKRRLLSSQSASSIIDTLQE